MKTYFVIFQGGGGGGVWTPVITPSGAAHASQEIFSHVRTFPGLNQYYIVYNVSFTRKQYDASRETQTNDPFI